MVEYRIESSLEAEEFKAVLEVSGLAERRPVHDLERLKTMLLQANIIVTARDHGKLVGVSRAISDLTYCTFLSDLAVNVEYQHQGIGKELIKQTKQAAPQAKLILLAAPAAVNYYPKIGMTRHEHCYFSDAGAEIL